MGRLDPYPGNKQSKQSKKEKIDYQAQQSKTHGLGRQPRLFLGRITSRHRKLLNVWHWSAAWQSFRSHRTIVVGRYVLFSPR